MVYVVDLGLDGFGMWIIERERLQKSQPVGNATVRVATHHPLRAYVMSLVTFSLLCAAWSDPIKSTVSPTAHRATRFAGVAPIRIPILCEVHSDCMLPEICCRGPLFDYCCDIEGKMRPLPIPANHSRRWPIPA